MKMKRGIESNQSLIYKLLSLSIVLLHTHTSNINSFLITITPNHNNNNKLSTNLYSTRKGKVKTKKNNERISKSNELLNWSKSVGIEIGGISISSTSSTSDNVDNELGIFTKQNLKPNDIVINVPNEMSVSVISPSDESSTPDISSILSKSPIGNTVYKEVPWYVKLSIILNILNKNIMGETSEKRQNWLNALPTKFTTPFHWDETTIQELQYPFLQQSILQQRTKWKNEYYTPYTTEFWNVFDISYEEFIWGCEIARSRAFSSTFTGNAFSIKPFIYVLAFMTIYVGLNLGTLEQAANGAAVVICGTIFKDFVIPKFMSKTKSKKQGESGESNKRYTICPIIDMCNHVGINEMGNVAFEYFRNCYSLSMVRDLGQGEELFISYGPRSNDQLLQYYGFVEEDNVHDVYIMPPLREWDIDMLEEACGRSFSLKRIEYLNSLGLLGPSKTATTYQDEEDDILKGGVVITKNNGIDPAIKQVLRILISTDEEWYDRGKENIAKFSEQFGVENEKCLNRVIYKAVEFELGRGTSVKEDEEILKRLDDVELGLAVRFRLEKKKLLMGVLADISL